MAKKWNDKPFGNRDANEKNDKDLTDLVDVGDLMPSFSYDSDPTRVRVLVGRKGTGKTHASRLLQVESRRRGHEVLSRVIDRNLADEKLVRSHASRITASRGVASWEQIWKCALAVAALSRFCCKSPDQGAREALTAKGTDAAQIRAEWPDYTFDCQNMLDPLGALTFMIDRSKNVENLSQLAMSPLLEELEAFVSGLMRYCEPTHFFIDGFDEHEERDPMLWLEIQLGLFWLAFRSNIAGRRLRRVYLTIAVRDGVLAAAQRSSMNADRFDYGDHIMVLTWSKEAATLFFRETLFRIRSREFWRASRKWTEKAPEVGWLGISTVKPTGRTPEALIDYLVRHSRCTPRDLIDIGNALAHKFNKANVEQINASQLVSSAVRATALGIGEFAINAAAQELVRDPDFPIEDDPQAVDYFRKTVIPYLESIVVAVVANAGKEIVSQREFETAVDAALDALGPEGDRAAMRSAITSAMWRNGVVAVQSRNRNHPDWKYVWSEASSPVMKLPEDRPWIGFHPSMFEIKQLQRHARGPVF